MATAALRAFPAEIPSLVAAYDPSDLSTLFQNAAGTIPAGVGDPVRLMLDRSGNGRHLRAESDAARPVLQSSGGLYWLESDGVDDMMVADDGVMYSQTVYMALAYRLLSFSANFPSILSHAQTAIGDDAGRQPLIYHASTNPNQCRTHYGSRVLQLDLAYPVLGADLVVDGHITTVSSHKNVNGMLVTAGGATLLNSKPEAMRIFGTTRSNARFYGALRTHAIPTAAQQLQIRQWLAAKSGGIA
ncbi:hypothetical protein [Arenibacterium sp. LLYu02]|uniref:hypothetical protein n=1 Tax=Arenibacterium sp. LLYu02 TaxID=3404132 RepID=UPI003B21A163